MARVMFKRIEDSADIDDTPIVDGQFIVTKDGKIFIDYGETRSEISGAGGGSSAPVGTISQFAGNTIPEGWLACDGTAVSRTTYASLFAKIGTTYGTGDGSTTFNLPNFNGKVPVGLDTTQGEFDTLGEDGGEKYHTLTVDEIPKHSHGIGYAMNGGSGSASAIMSYQPSATFQTNIAGNDQGHLNLQPYLTINFIIKALNITEATGTVDSLPIGSILDYDGDTAPEGYSEVADYSTSEIDTGMKWIDGSKIYRKVIPFTLSSTTGSFQYEAHNISNIGAYRKIELYYVYNNGYYKTPNDTIIELGVNDTNIAYYNNNQYIAGVSAYAILEYTKTS